MFKYFAFVFFFTFSAYANDIKNITIEYDLYAGGLKGVLATIDMRWQGNNYEFKTTTKTRGFIGLLYPVVATQITKGLVKNDLAFPKSYISTSVSRRKKTVKELEYDDKGRVVEQTNIRKGEETTRNIDDDMGYGKSLDYQSVIAMMLWRLDKGLDCNQDYVAFDGKRRYTMIFNDLGMSEIKQNSYSSFADEARLCSLTIEPFNNDYPSNSWFWHRSGKKGKQMPLKIWTAKLNNMTIPVRIEIDSLGFGAIIAHMTSVL